MNYDYRTVTNDHFSSCMAAAVDLSWNPGVSPIDLIKKKKNQIKGVFKLGFLDVTLQGSIMSSKKLKTSDFRSTKKIYHQTMSLYPLCQSLDTWQHKHIVFWLSLHHLAVQFIMLRFICLYNASIPETNTSSEPIAFKKTNTSRSNDTQLLAF